MVVMQNSGLGVSLNALASLHVLYRLPALLLVTWRGYAGTDAPEHRVMGSVLLRLLDLFDTPHREPTPDSLEADVAWAAAELRQGGRPVALVVRPGLFDAAH
jgi:phosphonopyruvate decarboxylase